MALAKAVPATAALEVLRNSRRVVRFVLMGVMDVIG
jgi:hypothetical protein